MVLEAYSHLLSLVASSASIPLLLSPSLVCRDIIKKGSSDHLRPMTFVGGLTRSVIFVQYGILSGLQALIRVHSIGAILYMGYLFIYYKYCTQKGSVINLFMKAVLFMSVLLGFANFKPDSFVTLNFGTIATILHLSIIGLPLLNIRHIIRKKSTAGLPFPIIFCGNFVAISWMLYGISINNFPLILQSGVTAVMTMTQLSLFVIYPSRKEEIEKKKE